MLDQNITLPVSNLAYLDSEEPDEQSQANALNAIDKILSLEETFGYTSPFQNNCTSKIAENLKSGPSLSSNVAKFLSKSNKLGNNCSFRKMEVFDWVNEVAGEKENKKEKENENENEKEDYISYDVGPMTQVAAEAIQELFNNYPNKIENNNNNNNYYYNNDDDDDKNNNNNCNNNNDDNNNNNSLKREKKGDTEINENEKEIRVYEKEIRVFKHPKKRRSNMERKRINNKMSIIFDNVKRKGRSSLIRHNNRGQVGNFEEKNISEKLKFRERYEGWANDESFSRARKSKKNMNGIRVLFSQNLDPKIVKQQKKILSRFKLSSVASISDATHFVADRFARTKNMLQAIATGVQVATPDWLLSCAENDRFVNEDVFLLTDVKKEKEIGFCLKSSIKMAQEKSLLEGWRVLVTQKVKPDKDLIKCLFKASDGQLVERITRHTMEDEENLQGNFFIISCKEDYRICLPLLKLGIEAYDSELLLNGIVIQKLEFDRHRLFAGEG